MVGKAWHCSPFAAEDALSLRLFTSQIETSQEGKEPWARYNSTDSELLKPYLAPVPKRSASTLVVNQASKACTHERHLRFKPEQQCNAWLSLVEMKSNNN